MRGSRASALAWVTLSYLLALVAGVVVIWLLPEQHLVWHLFWADVAGTLVVFAFSVAFNNSSVYDPYWSVAPFFLALGYWWLGTEEHSLSLAQGLVLGLVAVYAFRLTHNWARGWTGMDHEDWRYVILRNKHGKAYWPVSLAGIHMMPTVLVFLGCLPLGYVFAEAGFGLGLWEVLGLVVMATSIFLEGLADNQLRKFRLSKPPKGAIMDRGIWAWSRHPNYFGEILFWWGLAMMVLSTELAWMAVGAVSITLLFLGISIPMIDKRMLERRPHYAEHKRKVSMLVPWPPRKSGASDSPTNQKLSS